MTFPELPPVAPGDVPLLAACYQDDVAEWGDLPAELDGEVVVLEGTGVRLHRLANPGWAGLLGGNIPALLGDGPVPPVAVLADSGLVHGEDGPLLVDLAGTPGRGARVETGRLGEVLAALRDGSLGFDDLVRGLDVYGTYQGDGDRPLFPTPVEPAVRTFPALPATDGFLVVRTDFADDAGWAALLAGLGGADADGRFEGDAGPGRAVADQAFAGLPPGPVPALVPPGHDTTLVALADARTFAADDRPLTVVDLGDVPGRSTGLPAGRLPDLAANLLIGNMDFCEFVLPEGGEW